MMVALLMSLWRLARLDMTFAPSMPMKTHIMTSRQLRAWVPMPPKPDASPDAAAALLATLPQKSAVNTPMLNTVMTNTMNTKIEMTFTAMTMALSSDALSTPRITRYVSAHRTTDTSTTAMTLGELGEPNRAGLIPQNAWMTITPNRATR